MAEDRIPFVQHPLAKERSDQERSSRSDDLAVEVMKLAVEFCKNSDRKTNAELCETAEWIWRWSQSESIGSGQLWPQPTGCPI